MKRLAAILFLAVTGFSIFAPAWEQYGKNRYQICLSDPDCDDGCCPDCCSPFYSCGLCYGFEPVVQTLNCPVPSIRKFIPTPYIQAQITAFYLDIWQPPKFT
jgi:hypothetical protein